ncbi:MAG: SDR family NAD(P)-dependent oxidoreductase [Actinomycetota bacterium]|nr:SDR family NAD(P)-dependent oxidoreductase [Actinomycetota bacterium]
MLLSNQVAIVTGAAQGIGKGIALKFAEEGCFVAIADIRDEHARETLNEVKSIGSDGLALSCDVTSSGQVAAMVEEVIGKFGRVDILVNNAGNIIGSHAAMLNSIGTLPEEDWDQVVALNLKSAFLCSRAVVSNMRKNNSGKIVNISSLGAVHPPKAQPHYHAAKAGILGLTYDMASELGPDNIRVNAIMPGPIRTPFYDPMLKDMPEDEVEEFFRNLGKLAPLQRVGTPADIAGAAVFLASDLSSYVTGAVLPVSGGMPLSPGMVSNKG